MTLLPTAFMKIGPLTYSKKFCSFKGCFISLTIYNTFYLECCCHISSVLDKLQRSYIFPIGLSLGNSHLSWLNFFIFTGGPLIIIIAFRNDFPATISRYDKDDQVNSIFCNKARIWTLLPSKCFSLNYDLNGFTSTVNRQLLTWFSF